MKYFSKNARPQISRVDALAGIPTKNPVVQTSPQDDGTTLLTYPLAMRPFWTQILEKFVQKPKDMIKKLELDAMGTEVWDLIDGEKTVQDIVLSFSRSHNISNHEAEMSVSLFLRELGKRKIIAIA